MPEERVHGRIGIHLSGGRLNERFASIHWVWDDSTCFAAENRAIDRDEIRKVLLVPENGKKYREMADSLAQKLQTFLTDSVSTKSTTNAVAPLPGSETNVFHYAWNQPG